MSQFYAYKIGISSGQSEIQRYIITQRLPREVVYIRIVPLQENGFKFTVLTIKHNLLMKLLKINKGKISQEVSQLAIHYISMRHITAPIFITHQL
jgi:ABC-type branched-subunit amino acid transport system ATPase component